MILPLILATALQSHDPLEAAILAARAQKSAQVKATLSTNVSGRESVTRFILNFSQPDQARLEILEPQQKLIAPSDRIYSINGTQFVAYDRDANEYITRHTQTTGNLRKRLEAMIDSQDMAIQTQLDPDVLASLFTGLENPQVFSWAASGSKVVFTRKATGKGTSKVVLNFDPKSHLISSAAFESGKTHVRWTYSYSPVSTLVVTPPAGARSVAAFFQRPIPPTYVDAGSRKAIEASIAAYKRLSSLSYQVRENGRLGEFVSWSERTFYERDGALEAAYDGSTLTLKTGRNAYQGRCPQNDAADYMAAIGLNMEPTLRVLLTNRNPVQTLLRPNMKVRMAGQMVTGDGSITIVELQSKGQKIALSIRNSNNLLASTLTEVGLNGRVDLRTERTYQYFQPKRFNIGVQGAQPLSALHVQKRPIRP